MYIEIIIIFFDSKIVLFLFQRNAYIYDYFRFMFHIYDQLRFEMFQIILNLKMQKIQIIHMIKYESKIIKLCNEKKKNKTFNKNI